MVPRTESGVAKGDRQEKYAPRIGVHHKGSRPHSHKAGCISLSSSMDQRARRLISLFEAQISRSEMAESEAARRRRAAKRCNRCTVWGGKVKLVMCYRIDLGGVKGPGEGGRRTVEFALKGRR